MSSLSEKKSAVFSFKEYSIFFMALFLVCSSYNGVYYSYMRNHENDDIFMSGALFGNLIFTCLVISVVFTFVKHSYFIKPMKRLADAARKVTEGDFSVRVDKRDKGSRGEEMGKFIDDFNRMIEELSSIETLKNDFIANVSHEIKTPLSVIQSYAVALQDEEMDVETRNAYIKIIVSASQRLNGLVTNILKLNKLDNQEIFQQSTVYNLGEQLRCCTLTFEEICERKNIILEADIDDISVQYDESLLELVWNNLLSNAVKFTEEDGTIKVSLKQIDADIVVSIKDSGCGMNEYTKKHIFDKFYQGDTSHAMEGNGLGLALSKKVIDLAGGQIQVKSSLGQGSTFIVKLKYNK